MSLVLVAAAVAVGCQADSPTRADGGADSGGASSSGSASSSDTGVVFACAGARWYDGSLVVDDTTDVDALRDIGGITGHLSVLGTDRVTDLEFLGCVERIGGGLIIKDNTALTNLHGLERLAYLGPPDDTGVYSDGNVDIEGNLALEHLYELESLALLGYVSIGANPMLVDIDLPALTRIQSLVLGWCVDEPATLAVSNDMLSRVGDYPMLSRLGTIHIEGQRSFTSLASLVSLAERGVELETARFEHNPALSAAEIESFATASRVTPEVCQNMNDEELCALCPAD